MGGVASAVGGLFGGGGGGSAPAAPDYTGAANATAANNLKAAQAATAANRVNQYTPYGALNYSQTGQDSQGNPMWSATQSVAPGLQPAVATSQANVSDIYQNPFTGGNLPSYGINPGETYSNAIMRRLQPTQTQQSQMSDQQLANQGIMPGSEAYNNAKRLLAQSQNDQLTSAIVGGMNTGLQANQQQYGQNLTTYNNALANALGIKSLATPNYINPAQQQTTTGADILGATNAQYQNQLASYNASQAKNSNALSGLFGLGGAALMSPTGTFSGLSGLFGGGVGMMGSATPNWSNPYAGYDNGGGVGLSGIE
jgi:hypothetical protein